MFVISFFFTFLIYLVIYNFLKIPLASPLYKQIKHLLEAPKKLKNSLQKKAPNLRKQIPTSPNLKEFWNKEKRKKKKKNR
jgi:hypothetical protein